MLTTTNNIRGGSTAKVCGGMRGKDAAVKVIGGLAYATRVWRRFLKVASRVTCISCLLPGVTSVSSNMGTPDPRLFPTWLDNGSVSIPVVEWLLRKWLFMVGSKWWDAY